MRRRPQGIPSPRSGFAGLCSPPDVIMIAVRWYLRYGLSYRDVEELLAKCGIGPVRRIDNLEQAVITANAPDRSTETALSPVT